MYVYLHIAETNGFVSSFAMSFSNMNKAHTNENESNFEHAINEFVLTEKFISCFCSSKLDQFAWFSFRIWCDDFEVENDSKKKISFNLLTNVNLNVYDMTKKKSPKAW